MDGFTRHTLCIASCIIGSPGIGVIRILLNRQRAFLVTRTRIDMAERGLQQAWTDIIARKTYGRASIHYFLVIRKRYGLMKGMLTQKDEIGLSMAGFLQVLTSVLSYQHFDCFSQRSNYKTISYDIHVKMSKCHIYVKMSNARKSQTCQEFWPVCT